MQGLLDEFNLATGKNIALDRSLGPLSQTASDPSMVGYRLCDCNASGPSRTLLIRICEFRYEQDRAGNWTFGPEDAKSIKSAIESFFDGRNNEHSQILDIPVDEH
jgi:hypothetical protein